MAPAAKAGAPAVAQAHRLSISEEGGRECESRFKSDFAGGGVGPCASPPLSADPRCTVCAIWICDAD